MWIDIIYKQSGSNTIQWLDPKKNISYILPKSAFEIYEEDFRRVALDYVLFKEKIDAREFKEKIVNELLYSASCEFTPNEEKIKEKIILQRNQNKEGRGKIDTSKWKPFIIGKLASNNIEKPEKRAFTDYSEGPVPFVASGNYNNGVKGYVKAHENEVLDKGNCITVSAVDGSAFYQKTDFLGRGGGGSSINIIRHDKINEYTGLFMAAVIGKVCGQYKYADMCSAAALQKETIYLPSIGAEPDWRYMEGYIKSLPYAEMILT